jgi:hypothetical protein
VTIRLGIKVGPENWRAKLDHDPDIERVEVFTKLSYIDADPAVYETLFAELRARGIEGSLHASSTLESGLDPNLATADDEVRNATRALLKRTIDLAAEHGMRYVIIHPGSAYVWGVPPKGYTYRLEPPTPPDEACAHAIEEMHGLVAYGQERGVIPLAENLPGRDYVSYSPPDRTRTIDVEFLPYTVLREMGEQGIGLCVDIGHVYAELAVSTTPPQATDEERFADVVAATRELVPYAQCVHLSTTAPPHNGTDCHLGFLPEDAARGALPTREQLLSWLALFHGHDVWAIPEPMGDAAMHIANYQTLRRWLEELP